MTFVLSEDNVSYYLSSCDLVNLEREKLVKLDCCSSKNFNLVVTFSDQRCLLVKQKRLDDSGQFKSDFYDEWRVSHLIQTFPELSQLGFLTSEVLHHDPTNAILVSVFFSDYQDLRDFHENSNQFSPQIGAALGQSIAQIHRSTYQNSRHRDFLLQNAETVTQRIPKFLNRFDRLSPDIFGIFCQDGIDFFRILQRTTALSEAIASLKFIWNPSCLIHRDLKLDNLLLLNNFPEQPNLASIPLIKIIDWELFTWGDPLYDVGTLLGSYLMLWLETLIVKPGLPMSQTLRLAETPLELVQPSLIALLQAYLQTFPEILNGRQNTCTIILQYAGFYIFQRMVHHLSRHEPFNQKSLCSLQVVKRLLCDPELSFGSILGVSLSEFELQATSSGQSHLQ